MVPLRRTGRISLAERAACGLAGSVCSPQSPVAHGPWPNEKGPGVERNHGDPAQTRWFEAGTWPSLPGQSLQLGLWQRGERRALRRLAGAVQHNSAFGDP